MKAPGSVPVTVIVEPGCGDGVEITNVDGIGVGPIESAQLPHMSAVIAVMANGMNLIAVRLPLPTRRKQLSDISLSPTLP